MEYAIVAYDPVNLITTIQVTGCALETYIDTSGTTLNGPDYYALLDMVAQSVLTNMDPESPTYDPTLIG
jgi:hypothetical protein